MSESFESLGGAIDGVLVWRNGLHADSRGWFRDLWRVSEDPTGPASPQFSPVQVSSSCSLRGVIRGLHYSVTEGSGAYYQTVSCVNGRASDVLLDLRTGSPTYMSHLLFDLHADADITLFVPPGVAHGFQAVEDQTLLVYTMSKGFAEARTLSIRPDSPELGFWSMDESTVISDRDRFSPSLTEASERGLLPSWGLGEC